VLPGAEAVEDRAARPAALAEVGVDRAPVVVGELLSAASRRVRGRGPDLSRADLAGADLRTRDLRDASLRGALLIAADLSGTDLGRADLLGADLRDADVRGTDLGDVLFLTQPQLEAARGDAGTAVPAHLRRPAHWS